MGFGVLMHLPSPLVFPVGYASPSLRLKWSRMLGCMTCANIRGPVGLTMMATWNTGFKSRAADVQLTVALPRKWKPGVAECPVPSVQIEKGALGYDVYV